MAAVDAHAVLLRLAASNTGNDHRLGANEAPPAIISMYLGDQVGDVVDQIIKNGEATSSLSSGEIDFGIKRRILQIETEHHHSHLQVTDLNLEWLLHQTQLVM